MDVYRCERCEGCGYITGGFRWEVAWVRCVGPESDGHSDEGLLEAHGCPDCGGTGALIVMTPVTAEPALPTRFGVPVRDRYARHVSLVRKSQARHKSS
jgi:hypothetical protein